MNSFSFLFFCFNFWISKNTFYVLCDSYRKKKTCVIKIVYLKVGEFNRVCKAELYKNHFFCSSIESRKIFQFFLWQFHFIFYLKLCFFMNEKFSFGLCWRFIWNQRIFMCFFRALILVILVLYSSECFWLS